MAETLTLARPYAEAAFRLAQETGALASWLAVLQRLAALATDAQMHACLVNPGLTAAQKADLLHAAAQPLDDAQQRLVRVLADNNRITLLPEIAESFAKLKAAAEGLRTALINSAFDLSADQIKALMPALERRFCSAGGRLTPQVAVDARLIGGIRVQVGDQVLDASVRGKLDALAATLTA